MEFKSIQDGDTNLRYSGTDPETGLQVYHADQSTRLKAHIAFMNAREFAGMETQVLEPILGPITTASLTMIYAARGVGKTFFCLSAALAMAQGISFNGWTPQRTFRVGYIDGEMQGKLIQERMAKLNQGKPLPENLFIYNPELGHIPNIGEEVWRKAVLEAVEQHKMEVLFLDNLATLIRSGRENEREYWLPIQELLIELRSRGVAVVLVHHANKSGGQRGTSSKEDIVDIVMRLSTPEHAGAAGAHFRVDITKGRSLSGSDLHPCELCLHTNEEGFFEWRRMGLSEAGKPLSEKQLKAAEMLSQGFSQREIAQSLGLDESTVSKWKSRGHLEGARNLPQPVIVQDFDGKSEQPSASVMPKRGLGALLDNVTIT